MQFPNRSQYVVGDELFFHNSGTDDGRASTAARTVNSQINNKYVNSHKLRHVALAQSTANSANIILFVFKFNMQRAGLVVLVLPVVLERRLPFSCYHIKYYANFNFITCCD